MTDAYRRLADALPPRRAADSSSFPSDPRRVKAWVEALPRANQAATFKQLEDALESLAQIKLDGGQRLGALDVLRQPILEACTALSQQVIGSAIPLLPAKARAYDQWMRFEERLAAGYQLAVVEYCAPSGSVPFLRGGVVAQALVRAMLHASRCLLQSFLLYREPAAGNWARLHQLFGFARAIKLEDKAVEEPTEKRSYSLAQIYLQSLLIAYSNPYRFSQKEQADFWPLSSLLVVPLQFSELPAGDDCFGVPLDSDNGPGYVPAERAKGRESALWVDLAETRRWVGSQLEGKDYGALILRQRGQTALEVQVDLLRRVLGGWGRATSRRNQRLAAGHALDAVMGLSGLHFYLAGLADFDSFLGHAGVAGDEEGDRAAWARSAVDAGRIPLYRAEVVDQSLGGYHLRWSDADSVKARVGELLGLSIPSSEEERRWVIGVIRWLRFSRDGSVDAGIELLSRRARAVALRALDGGDSARPAQRGIQYEAVRRAEGESLLHFVAPQALESIRGSVEVLRVPDVDDVDEPVPLRERIAGLEPLENAGDYLLMRQVGPGR